MSDETPQPQRVPPIKEVRYINAGIMVGDADEAGHRELTFETAPFELMTFLLTGDAQEHISEKFKPPSDLVVAPAGALPPDPPS